MTSVQPISSAALASLIWEIDNGASGLFGEAPYNDVVGVPGNLGKRLANVLTYMRDRVVPGVLDSLNLTKVEIIRRTETTDDEADPLNVRFVKSSSMVFAVIAGPTTENIENGLLAHSDFEALIAAKSLDPPLKVNDAIKVNSVNHDIVAIHAHPRIPPAVAYRYALRRAAA